MLTALSETSHIVVYVTAPVDQAPQLARNLVAAGLAACVNIIAGVRSIYAWEGEICDDEEALLVIKTRAERLPELRSRVVELHPYDVPEVIALPIVDGHSDYLDWIDRNTR